MKKQTILKKAPCGNANRRAFGPRCIGAALMLSSAIARALDAVSPEQQYEGGTNTFINWIELSSGVLLTGGYAGQAQQRQRLSTGIFGGIEDLHYQREVAKNTTFSLDGRSVADNHDYKFGLGLRREDYGFVRFNFEKFRTWDSGVGGFSSTDALAYALPGAASGLDRGQISLEAGLTKKNLPKVTFKYTHRYREGEKSSTSWGPDHTSDGTRALFPGLYTIDEKTDIFQIDVTQRVRKTEVGAVGRLEIGTVNDTRGVTFWHGEPVQQRASDRQETTWDTGSVHAFSETWLKPGLFFSTAFLFASLDDNLAGSRIYGDDFNVAYLPGYPALGYGYYNLNGGARKTEYVGNLNLLSQPTPFLSVTPSLRIEQEDWDAHSGGMGTLGAFAPEPFTAQSERNSLQVRERLDLRYTGVTNWVFGVGGEWTESQGSLRQSGGLSQIAGIGPAPLLNETDDSTFFQKYSVNARWYPVKQASVDFGGYHKANRYNYTNPLDSTPNNLSSGDAYPGFLIYQGFETEDGNVRLTLRPAAKITLVTRYEYQISDIRTGPNPASGLDGVEASRMRSHVLGQNASWTPLSWLSLQAGLNFVLSTTQTPASDHTQALLNARNNYWTANFNSGFVLDAKTGLNLGYFYYRANDYQNIIVQGVPYGAGAEEHSLTSSLTRRISSHLRLNLKYAFTRYSDAASGQQFSYDAHVIFTSLQYRF